MKFSKNNISKQNKASLAAAKRWKHVNILVSSNSRPTSPLPSTSSNNEGTSDVLDIEVRPSTSSTITKLDNPINSLYSNLNNKDSGVGLGLSKNLTEGSSQQTNVDKAGNDTNQKACYSTRISDLATGLNGESELGLNLENCVAAEYKLVDIACLNELVSNLACPSCLECNLSISASKNNGFACELSIECKNCPDIEIYTPNSKRLPGSKSFDVNRKVVKAFMSNGERFAALDRFCMIMNMNNMSPNTFSKHNAEVSKSTVNIGKQNLAVARARVREVHKEGDSEVNEDSLLDVCVSYDGTWHKRGHTSNYGIGIVIEVQTGLVLDYVVLSKYCHTCAVTTTELGADSPEFDIWFQGHKPDCSTNFHGSSAAMETKAAEILWKRSLDYNMRYRTIVSDGDSAVFSHLQSLNVYGNNFPITKEECVNHVSKRLGTGLRNAVKVCKAKGITLGGRSDGSLTEVKIVKLTKYYKTLFLGTWKV